MEFHTELKNTILENGEHRYCEIYKIVNLINNKVYIGKAVSHILNHNKYRPYGMEGRFRCHVSEAFSTKLNQCHYLNNAIRKYTAENFSLQLLCNCSMVDADRVESDEILKNNSLYPNGYNLNTGGISARHTDESRKRVSNGVIKYFKDKKVQRFSDVEIDDDCDIEKYVRPLNRNNIQYGWYVYIQRKKADFGGSCISLEDSKIMAINFIQEIKNYKKELLARHLVAGNP